MHLKRWNAKDLGRNAKDLGRNAKDLGRNAKYFVRASSFERGAVL
jgi:hypothetical protein